MSQVFATPRTSHTALPSDDKNITVAAPSLPQEVMQSANIITTMKSSLEDLGVSEVSHCWTQDFGWNLGWAGRYDTYSA